MSMPDNPYESSEPVRKGMSGGVKVLLGVGIGCGVLMLLCCGVFGGAGYFFARSVEKAVVTDPEKIDEIAEEIVTIEIPESLHPKTGMDLTIPVIGQHMSFAQYMGKRDSLLMLGQFNNSNMREQLKDAMRQQSNQNWNENEPLEAENFETTIHDQKALFKIGKDRQHPDKWVTFGSFEGKNGSAMLIMSLDQEEFSKDELMDILRSMK